MVEGWRRGGEEGGGGGRGIGVRRGSRTDGVEGIAGLAGEGLAHRERHCRRGVLHLKQKKRSLSMFFVAILGGCCAMLKLR